MSLFLAILRIYERETAASVIPDPALAAHVQPGPTSVRTPSPPAVRIIEVPEKEQA
jgi:hypothetical protein